jgi:hypothetical protein
MKNKKNLGVLVIAFILSSLFIISGCETQSVDTASSSGLISDVSIGKFISPKSTGDLVDISEIRKISKIQDPQIIAETDWMYRNGHMSKDQFCNLHKNGVTKDEVLGSGYIIDHLGYPNIDNGEQNDINKYTREYVQQNLITERNNPNSARHQVFSTMYGGGTIKVRIQSNLPSGWVAAVSQACTAWNSLGYNINFSPYTATTTSQKSDEIDIIAYDLSNIIGAGVYANTPPELSSKKFREYIMINTKYDAKNYGETTASAKKETMMHELGHAIGLAHTDEWDANMVSGVLCAGSAYNDRGSFMRRIIINNSPAAFSYCDLQVIHKYW